MEKSPLVAAVARGTAIDAAIVRVADAIEARGSVTGSERSRMPWISVKIAVLAPNAMRQL